MSERLEEIKNGTYLYFRKHNELKEDMDWLIEQARRVQELEKDIKEWEIVNESWEEINTQIVEQNKRYREAIEFGIEYLKNSDIRQVQLVVTALKSALEGEE